MNILFNSNWRIAVFMIICFSFLNCKKENNDDSDIPKKIILTQPIKVQKEDKSEIAEKMKPPGSTVVHEVLEMDFWNLKNVIIVFYESKYVEKYQYKNERQFVECYLLVPDSKYKYEKILVNKFEDDNVDTEIKSVFFANADDDKGKELIIISTCKHRLEYLYEGTEFMTDVFDNIDLSKKSSKNSLSNLFKMSEKLTGGFQGFTEDNPQSQAKFKNANEVKAELKRLGL